MARDSGMSFAPGVACCDADRIRAENGRRGPGKGEAIDRIVVHLHASCRAGIDGWDRQHATTRTNVGSSITIVLPPVLHMPMECHASLIQA